MRRAALLLSLLSLGCALLSKGQSTDPDAKRERAEVVPIGGSAEDSLNVKESDASDWKAIEVPEEGRLRVVVTFGNRSCFCAVELLDPKGKKIATHKDIDSKPRTDLIIEKAVPGRYLLHFTAKYEGDFSAYLVEPVFRAAVKPRTPTAVEDDPEVEAATEPAPAPEPVGIAAKITRSKPGKSGLLVLTLDKGSEDGLSEGDQGLIDGLEGGELRITKVEKKSATAETAVTAKALKGYSTVTIKPKK